MKKLFTLFAICAMAVTSAMAQTTGTAKATIDGTEVEIGWVQLWKDGPKFATRNVGATGTSDKESTRGTTMSFTKASKTGSDYVWGANWKTPSKDEMDLLNTSNVSCSYELQDKVWGFKFTGKGDYSSNSIFLPAFGTSDSDDGNVYYWSSTSTNFDASMSYFLDLEYHSYYYGSWSFNNQSVYYHVRPVLAAAPAATEVTLSEDDETYPEALEWDASKTYDITLNRTMKANRWNTLSLPFPMTADEVTANFGSDVTLMKMTDIKDNVVSFETATAIEAGIGNMYIVKPTKAISQIKVTGKTGLDKTVLAIHSVPTYFIFWYAQFDNSPMWQVSCNPVQSKAYSKEYTTMYVLSNDNFYTVDDEVDVKGYRWVISAETEPEYARTLTLSLDGVIDETTGISNVDASTGSAQAQANGKFIQDGRMVIVKDGKKFNAAGQEVK